MDGVPTGIRTPVPTVKGSCPRPLDDGDTLHAMQVLYQLSYTPDRENAFYRALAKIARAREKKKFSS